LLRTEMRPETFSSLINVLVRNSLEWRLEDRSLEMKVSVQEQEDNMEILFSDNGQGVRASLEDKLFEADAEKRRLEEERDTTRPEVAALQAQVRGLERDKRTLVVQAWETKHIYR
jgi:light-regulated signal transduction histidine kinase (bacteriophytochrome)